MKLAGLTAISWSGWPSWGWPAVTGLLALLAGLCLSLLLAPQWHGDAQLLQAQALNVPRKTKPPPKATSAPVALTWPAAALTPRRVAALLALATQHGVTVEQMQQRADPNGCIQLSLGAHAPYAALRQFVAAALAADAHLALTQLRMQRASAAAAELDAQLQWLLVQQRPARGAVP
jgi:Na+/H+-dicarboxylate symporter